MTAAHVPAHDLDAELAVLSACLLDATGAAYAEVAEVLVPESYYSPANRLVWSAVVALAASSQPVDAVTVASWLLSRERLTEIGGAAYLARVTDAAPSVANVGAYARTVRLCHQQRAVVAECQRAVAEGYGDVGDVATWTRQISDRVAKLAIDPKARKTSAFLGDVVHDVFDKLRRKGSGIRVSTGLRALDEIVCAQAGDLIVIAGRPGMGKSALAGGIAVSVGLAQTTTEHQSALLLSAEMPREQIAQRLLAAESQVPLGALRHANVSDEGWSRLTESAQVLDQCALVLDDKAAPSLAHVLSMIQDTKRNVSDWETATGLPRALRLVVVDYLQIMGVESAKGKNREQEIAELTRGLKQIARDQEVVVVALSQLNRGVEARANKRPTLADLRESGAIEQDADVIVFAYRDEYYNPSGRKGVAELIVEKNRNGAPGRAFTRFTGAYTMFSDLSADEERQLQDEADEPRKGGR